MSELVTTDDLRAVVLVWTVDEQAFGYPFWGPGCLGHAQAFATDLRDRNEFPGALVTVSGTAAAAAERQEWLLAAMDAPSTPRG